MNFYLAIGLVILASLVAWKMRARIAKFEREEMLDAFWLLEERFENVSDQLDAELDRTADGIPKYLEKVGRDFREKNPRIVLGAPVEIFDGTFRKDAIRKVEKEIHD